MIFTEALDGKVDVGRSVFVQEALDPAILQTEIRELLKVTVVGLDPSLDVGLLEPVRDALDGGICLLKLIQTLVTRLLIIQGLVILGHSGGHDEVVEWEQKDIRGGKVLT